MVVYIKVIERIVLLNTLIKIQNVVDMSDETNMEVFNGQFGVKAPITDLSIQLKQWRKAENPKKSRQKKFALI